MLYNNVEFTVLIKGKPITEYPHMGQVFVEGRDGSQFELAVHNRNPFRVEAVISVDGLSVTDGKDAGPQSSGYLIEANERIVIPGWKLNADQVAAFEFAGKGDSYAALTTGSARNTGVLGVMIFKEKQRQYTTYHSPMLGGGYQPFGAVGIVQPSSTAGQAWGMMGIGQNSVFTDLVGGIACSAEPSYRKGIMSQASTRNVNTRSYSPQQNDEVELSRGLVQQDLGTGFGAAQDFQTTEVQFERGDMTAMIVLYYDSARGLKQRGIVIDRRTKRVKNQQPNAFPGMSAGCVPPKGWRA